MIRSKFIGVVLLAGCASAGTGTTVTPKAPMPEPIEPSVAVATFDTVWSVVERTYVDTAFVKSKWSSVRTSLRPRAKSVTTRASLNALLADMLAQIHDSHFYMIPAAVASEVKSDNSESGNGTTGLAVRLVSDGAIAWRVEPGSPAEAAGIVPGQYIESVNDRLVRESLKKVTTLTDESRQRGLSELAFRLNGPLSPPVGDTAKVTVLDGNGRSHEKILVAVPKRGTVSKFGNLPPIAGVVSVNRRASGASCIGVIAFNIWLPLLSPELERAVKSVADCAGIVIDVRGNPGGVGAMVMGFGGFFVPSPVSLGTMRTRDLTLNFAINPRRVNSGPYEGPVAILVDPMSASTSEIFAAGMQRIGRARVFGQRSAAAALPALMQGLPSGDVFVHAVADFRDPKGGRIEGSGVIPDEIVPLTQADAAKQIDAPLEAAVRWIGLRLKP
jgi:carboxyl-terminal processing protease